MARVKGPLFSLTASGTYEKSLCFRTTSAGTHVLAPPKQKSTRSLAQNDHNARVKSMSQKWNTLTDAAREAWATCGAAQQKTGFQLFWQEWFTQNSTYATPPTNPCA